ncbi:MAG: valine--tRNA ligase [Alphaproteobacteria bacterium]|nr:valine--tRNA ligase [Alphaproteobacteria bacterium]
MPDNSTAAPLDKTYHPAETESRIYGVWEKSGAFECGRVPPGGVGGSVLGKPFTIVIPPPNVTGSLHMGHALNNTLQDILIRWRRMQGRDALWQPGTDHAGIATQMVVERQLELAQTNRHKLGRKAFVEKVWDWKAESGGTITRQLRRLGASCDWRRERFTMDEGLSRAVRKVFVDLYKQKLIYKDKRLVNWDPRLHTAISDLEVEQKEIKGKLWHIKYPIDGADGQFVVVATTRPETMLGDTGVAVHPEDARYTHLVGKHAVLPLVGRKLPIVADEYSDPEKGTGAVKMTPSHDFNDFEVGRRHKLEMVNIFDGDAKVNENAPAAYRGLDRYEARKRIVADLEAQGLIEKVDDHIHMVPHGDRSGVAIEPWLTDQWYCDAKTLAGPAIKAVEEGRTRFVPEQWTSTYYAWMRNIQPWSISRQLWWGHQIPAWYGPDGKIFVEMTEAEALAAAEAHYGKKTALAQDEDVLDTWFSSALWPFSTLGWPDDTPEVKRYYPTDVLVTGFDIIFFWVARMMMMGLHFMKEVPFHTVYIHALVRDERGQKMSKSKGNVMDPLDLIDKFGCDALRFTLTALAAQGRDIKLSESRLEGYRNFATKLWNASRYCQMNGCVLPPNYNAADAKLTVNRWILGEATRTAARVDAALEAYKFDAAAGALYQFVWGTFCDWYLEFTKPVLTGSDEAVKAETRAVTAAVLKLTLRLLHPIMPFITEELWEKLGYGAAGTLIVERWPQVSQREADTAADAEADAEMDWVVRLISTVRTVRSEMNVPAASMITLHLRDAAPETLERLARHRDVIARLARLGEMAALDGAVPKGSAQAVLDEATLVLPLAGVIDLAAERQRLGKELDKVGGEIGKIDKKLGNADFMKRAPEEVVEEQRERRDEAVQMQERLKAALARIA